MNENIMLADLARLTLTMIEAQQAYFKCKTAEKSHLMGEAIRLEIRVARICKSILAPKIVEPSLFDAVEGGAL